MAEREHARDVRRRHHDRKRWLRRLWIRDEITIRQPALIPLRFNGIRVVSFGQFSHRDQSSESVDHLQIGGDAVLRVRMARRAVPTMLGLRQTLETAKVSAT